ncbi:PAS domain S-box protein [Haliea sp.]
MTEGDIPSDTGTLAIRLVTRAGDVCRQVEQWLAADDPPAGLWRDAHGLAGAAGALGAQPLAAAAAELARALRPHAVGLEADDRGRLVALAETVAHCASGMAAPLIPVGSVATACLVVGDSSLAATLEELLERQGYATQRLTDPAALLTDVAALPEPADRLLLCDCMPECRAALKAAGWFIVVIGEDDTAEACLHAVQAGADRFVAGPECGSRLLPILQRRVNDSGTAVLVVDDDPLSLDARAAVLRGAGFEVCTVREPMQVLEAMRAATPEAVLLDSGIGSGNVSRVLALLGSLNETCCDSVLLVGDTAAGRCPRLAPDSPAPALRWALTGVAASCRQRRELARKLRVLRQRRRREHEVVDTHALVSVTDRRGLILHANDQFCEVSGYSRDELIGQNHRIIKSDQHPPEFYADLWRTISSGHIWRGLVCNRRKDGRLYWVLSTISPYLDENGVPVRYVSLRTEVTELKSLQEQMRLRDRVLEETFNGVLITDARLADSPLIYVNPAFEKITGYSEAEVLGRNCRFLQGEESGQPVLAELRKALAEHKPASVVVRNYRKDGTLFWNDLNLSPIFDDAGRLTHYIGIQRDISQRISDEIALRETQENLRATLEATDDGILAVDEQRRTIFCSRRFEELSLFPEDSLQPGNTAIIRHDQIRDRVREPERFLERLEEIYRHPDQASHDVFERIDGRIIERDSMPLLRDGQVAGRVWHFKDVTSMHWVQREMESYKERLRLGQNYANIGTWDWDIGTGDLFWTERIPTLFGYPQGELQTSFDNFVAALHPDDRQSVLDAINACVEQDAPYGIEHRVLWPDGSVRWLSERGAVIRDGQGRAVRMIGVVQDIDDRKRAEIELVATREEAERANQAKSEFLSRMSHELRTPMNAVLGFAQIMEYDDTLPADHVDSVNEIIRAGNHLLELINEVLDLSKVESGSIDLSIEPVVLCSVVEECLSLIRPLAERRDITVEHEVCAATVVRADRMRLKQALLNLMSNGVKYNREGGRLIVEVVAVRDGEWVQVRIADTGRGLRSEQIARIFEPFDRLGIDSSEIEGTGIGLAITRRLVEMMGGNLGVDSVPGRGSTFWVELLKEELAPDTDLEDHSEESHLPGGDAAAGVIEHTVIYIEDNPSNIRLMAQVMAHRHHIRLLTAHTPDLGIELALSRRPDLILLDINLPGLDGYQVLRILRTEERLQSVPIIALSANALPRDIDRGRQAGFADYITKPLQIDYFLKVLDRHLDAGRVSEPV